MPYVIKAKISLEIFGFSFPLLCYLNLRKIACNKLGKKKSSLVNQKYIYSSKYRLLKFKKIKIIRDIEVVLHRILES